MREEIVTEPTPEPTAKLQIDVDTTQAQEALASVIEQTAAVAAGSFTMDELIVNRWMGVGVSVRLSDPAESDPDTLGVTVLGHNGPTAPQELRDVLQLAVDSLDATHGTSYAGGMYDALEDEPS